MEVWREMKTRRQSESDMLNFRNSPNTCSWLRNGTSQV